MSITLPYASAVNCKFVALPDSLATDDNTLKLYNIDGGGGGGGTIDAYTKAESDARYLKLVSSPVQTITQIPYSAGIKMSPGGFIDWAGQATGTTTPIRFKPVAGGSISISVQNQQDESSRSLTIAQINTGGAQFIVSNPTSAQTINNALTLTGAVTAAAFGTTGSVRISDVTIMSSNVSGAKNIFMPNLGASNGRFIVSDAATGQAINGLLNVLNLSFLATAATFNRGVDVIATVDETTTGTIASSSAVCNWTKNYAIPKTDIVTTVTGVSDTKVPSEKAVKDYVTSNTPSVTVYPTYHFVVSSAAVVGSGPTFAQMCPNGYNRTTFTVNQVDSAGTKQLCLFTAPKFKYLQFVITGYSYRMNNEGNHWKLTGSIYVANPNADTVIVSTIVGPNYWTDYTPTKTFFRFQQGTGLNFTLNAICDTYADYCYHCFTVETWVTG